MKVAHVAVYLDAVQAQKIRDDAQDTVLALDEDIEITTQIADLNARDSHARLSTPSVTFTSRSPTSSRTPARSSTAANTTCLRATDSPSTAPR